MSDCQRNCLWNHQGQCCPDSEEGFNSAKPNSCHCPTYLRSGLEEHLRDTYDNIVELIKHRNIKELEAIEDFILGQRLSE
jgi:hypothetical protein